ncbi:unnamed protein product [Zymoseptoria tritici ST99CH_1A5]|uniref:Non-structural maintenance of chromosomes element 1 homolog n=2 Tax=Zymoseptoria tritici TaxID=1047171 RepID=A0A1X7RJ58_ZYMT9|nr:unnamed protein product [Zymoseptoria tritici ST99CH_3D7]SMY20933.1 unnamed protein product [Zymoseptoria tritici ST99CH_1A5]
MSEEPDDRTVYGHKHKAFLQALTSRQVITFDEAKPLIAAIETSEKPDRPTQPGDITEVDFKDYVNTVNDAISPFDFEIRNLQHQTSKERVYAFVNTTSDALTQMSTMHSADEIAFVKRVLDAMFETYNTQRAEVMAITSLQALKLAKANESQRRESQSQTQAAQGLTMTQAEKALETMVEEGWFELSESGYYSLTPRALMELRGWLVDMYNEQEEEDDEDDDEEEGGTHVRIKFCAACRDIVTVGQRCPNLPCNARVHNACVRNMFRTQRDSEKCPACETAWRDPPPVGEKAAKSNGGRRSINGTAARRSNGSTRVEEEEDSDASGGAD